MLLIAEQSKLTQDGFRDRQSCSCVFARFDIDIRREKVNRCVAFEISDEPPYLWRMGVAESCPARFTAEPILRGLLQ